MRNFSESGSFSQTIHAGYDDKWTWSGHRAITLPIMAKLYGLHPTTMWLSILMISFVSLGGIAAGALGKRVMRSPWGFFWGTVVFSTTPAAAALALQDYQDLVFALPAFIFAVWAFSTGKLWLAVLGAVVGVMPREECVPMVLGLAVICPPVKPKGILYKKWFRNIFITGAIVGYYAWWAEKSFPIATSGHDMPLQNALRTLGSGQIFLEGWLYRYRFYLLLWVPMGIFALFSPLLGLAGAALCILHMSVPEGHGVDRSWGGHAHHMAPATAFAICAITVGSARFFRLLSSLMRTASNKTSAKPVAIYLAKYSGVPSGILLPSLSAWSIWWWFSWANYFNLIPSVAPKKPVWTHPVWGMIEKLPEGAVPVVSQKTSIAASNFLRSYTYDESLYNKEPHKGLQAATHIIVDQRREKVMDWIKRMPGYEELAEDHPFLLITWTPKIRDPSVMIRPKFSKVHAWTGPYSKGSDIPGVPPHEHTIPVQMGSFPVIQLWKLNRPP